VGVAGIAQKKPRSKLQTCSLAVLLIIPSQSALPRGPFKILQTNKTSQTPLSISPKGCSLNAKNKAV